MLRQTSVISSFFGSALSMPGRAAATLLNSCFTLYPALAEVSMNITFNSLAWWKRNMKLTNQLWPLTFLSPSSVDTCLLSERSVLLPTAQDQILWAEYLENTLTKHDDNITAPLRSDIINPLARLVKTVCICYVIHHNCNCAVSDVAEKCSIYLVINT